MARVTENAIDETTNVRIGWDDVIAYATRRIESLNAVIKVFKRRRDSGEPLIDESAEKE